MKNFIFLLLLFPSFLFAQPAGYYDGTSGLTGYALKSKLHEIISKKINSYNYSNVGDYYTTTDVDVYFENNGSILDIYTENPTGSEIEYTALQNISSANAEGLGWNREHGMPQSTYYGIYPMYSDIHYLIPADARINQLRSNYPYARTTGLETNGTSHNCNSPNTTPCIVSNGSKLGKSITPGYTNTVYEPIDEFKGDVARYLLYFVTRYEGSLNIFNHMVTTAPLDGNEERGYDNWYISMLLDWHNLDPVSQKEINRNNAVYTIQNIRNPFIDNPAWVNLIWNQTPDAVAPQAPQNLTISTIGESFMNLNWQPSTDSDVLGYKIYVNGIYYDFSKTNTYILDRLSPSTVYDITVKAYDNGYLLSSDSNIATATTLSTDNFAKDLMITKYIEGTTSSATNTYNNAIEITNKTNHEVKLTNYYLSIQFKGTGDTYYFSDSYKLEGTIAAGESKVVLHPFSDFATYNVSQADFVTNAPPLTYSGTQYVELSYGTKYLKTVSTNNYDMSYATIDAVGFKNTSNTLGNVSLYRNTDVTDPNVNFTIAEWTQNPNNYNTGLGQDATLESNEIFAIQNTLKIYPNPVSDELFITGKDFEKIEKATIYDISGRIILEVQQPFRKSNSLYVANLKPGLYFLNVGSQGMKFIKK